MATQDLAQALARAASVYERRPQCAVQDDAAASAKGHGGTRVISSHANGMQVITDMPAEFGGSGDQVSPGWLLRAGVASCTATCIAMLAAREGIELQSLDVVVGSRSDARGMLGVTGPDGDAVYAGPLAMQMHVRISAPGVPADRLRGLVDAGYRRSPMTCVVADAQPLSVHVDVTDR